MLKTLTHRLVFILFNHNLKCFGLSRSIFYVILFLVYNIISFICCLLTAPEIIRNSKYRVSEVTIQITSSKIFELNLNCKVEKIYFVRIVAPIIDIIGLKIQVNTFGLNETLLSSLVILNVALRSSVKYTVIIYPHMPNLGSSIITSITESPASTIFTNIV